MSFGIFCDTVVALVRWCSSVLTYLVSTGRQAEYDRESRPLCGCTKPHCRSTGQSSVCSSPSWFWWTQLSRCVNTARQSSYRERPIHLWKRNAIPYLGYNHFWFVCVRIMQLMWNYLSFKNFILIPKKWWAFSPNQFTTNSSKIIKFYHYNVIVMKDVSIIKHLSWLW